MSAIVFIENEYIKASFKLIGAELCSLFDKRSGLEHIWQADKEVWARNAPILFPIVGQVENNQYRIDNQSYSMTQHGFARDTPFQIAEHSEYAIHFSLESTEATLQLYPYQFELHVHYFLEGSRLTVRYEVQNRDSKTIYFSIGAHPGFACPFSADEKFSDYELKFQKNEIAQRLLFGKGLLTGEIVDYLTNEDTIALDYSIFEQDAIILRGLTSSWVELKNRHNNRGLRFYFEGFPLLAFWTSLVKNAPFICIEPWFGVADQKGGNKEFKEKLYVEKLAEKGVFNCEFGVEVRED